MGHLMRPDQPRRWLPVVAALVVAAAMIAPASAAVEDVDTPRVENLVVSAVGTAGGQKYVTITWDPPDVAYDDVEYRVLYSHDWRPQRSIQKLTEGEELRFTIRDEGAGFDWTGYLDFDPERALDPNGRGIAMSRLMSFSALDYRGKGNEVVASVRRT